MKQNLPQFKTRRITAKEKNNQYVKQWEKERNR